MYIFVHVDGKYGNMTIAFIGHSVNLGLDDKMVERIFFDVLCISKYKHLCDLCVRCAKGLSINVWTIYG